MRLEVCARAYDPPTLDNADQVVALPHAAFVIDGASSLRGEEVDGTPAAAWLAAALAQELSDFAGGALERFLDGAMARLSVAYRRAVPGGQHSDVPFCCLIACVLHPDVIEILSWGDCQAIITNLDEGQVDLFGFSSVTRLDEDVVHALQVRQNENGLTRQEAISTCYDMIVANRARRNVDRGYQILDLQPSGHVGVPERRFLDPRKPWRIMLSTDGLMRALTPYGIRTLEHLSQIRDQTGIDLLVREVRSLEADDNEGVRFPRIKSSDDIGAIVLECSYETREIGRA